MYKSDIWNASSASTPLEIARRVASAVMMICIFFVCRSWFGAMVPEWITDDCSFRFFRPSISPGFNKMQDHRFNLKRVVMFEIFFLLIERFGMFFSLFRGDGSILGIRRGKMCAHLMIQKIVQDCRF